VCVFVSTLADDSTLTTGVVTGSVAVLVVQARVHTIHTASM
jgi:hypothetical protein